MCNISERTEISGSCKSSRLSSCWFVELCHRARWKSVRESSRSNRTNLQRTDRATSSYLRVEGQPLAQVALNFFLTSDVWLMWSMKSLGRESRAYSL